MKTICIQLFAALLLFINISAIAQDSKSQAQKLTEQMKTDLTLTDDQTVQVLPINQSFVESLQTLRNQQSKLAKYREFTAADNKRDNALKEIFTSEQYNLFKKIKEENREALKKARQDKN
ncbi:MAG: hypothetical protein EBR30_23705 [Cytophagia bacterium]|nr:hypothetical protein [Cytophagia bacterium]